MTGGDFAHAGTEPRIEELLDDPIVHLLMRRDGLTRAAVLDAVTRARGRARAGRGDRATTARCGRLASLEEEPEATPEGGIAG